MAETDFLTGCLRKEEIGPIVDKIRAECDLSKEPFSILLVDLDNFKSYNDRYGHLDGDEVLKYFSSTLHLSLREETSSIFRFGGDEFIIVLPSMGGKEAHTVANNIMRNLKRRPFLCRGRIFKLSFSGGIASYPCDGNECEDIIRKADKAAYFSKTHGRRKTTLYKDVSRKIALRKFLIFTCLIFAALVLLFFQIFPQRGYSIAKLKEGIKKMGESLSTTSWRRKDNISYVIYLKSGRVLNGSIKRLGKDKVEVDLSVNKGRGSVIIDRSNIKKIERQSEALR